MQKTDFPIEIIIHDDCSTDDTAKIIRGYQQKHPQLINSILQTENQYSIKGFEFERELFKKARGRYIALCEGDDYWTDPYKLQKQVDFLELHPDYALCLHNSMVIYENGNASHVAKTKIWDTCTLEEFVFNFNDFTRDFLVCPAHTSSLIFRNHLITEFPDWFYRSKSGDLPLMILLCQYGKAKFINEVMSVYRIHSGGVSSSIDHATSLYENRAEMYEGLKSSLGYRYENVFNTVLAKYYRYIKIQKINRYIKIQKIKSVIGKSIKLIKRDGIKAFARVAKNRLVYQQHVRGYRKMIAGQVSSLQQKELGRVIEERMQKAHSFLDSLQSSNVFGAYRYSRLSKVPILYASVYAVLLKHLSGELERLSQSEKEAWAEYINTFQCECDGLYRDPLLHNAIAETEDWWGWRHLSAHVVTALAVLGVRTRYPFRFLSPLYQSGQASQWISELPWRERSDSVSNTIMNYGVLLQYERDFRQCEGAANALDEIFAFLDRTQDSATGLWGNMPPRNPHELSIGVQTAYHLWNLYFYDRRRIRYLDKAIDSCLTTQNKLGGYGVSFNSSACEDIDSIDPLCRFYFLSDYRRGDIKCSLERALPWILANQMLDGGFVFQRYQAFAYGHELMTTDSEEANLFATWFRILSIAYICQVLDLPEIVTEKWQWIECPGYQFWR